jgi:hypothetical protein
MQTVLYIYKPIAFCSFAFGFIHRIRLSEKEAIADNPGMGMSLLPPFTPIGLPMCIGWALAAFLKGSTH